MMLFYLILTVLITGVLQAVSFEKEVLTLFENHSKRNQALCQKMEIEGYKKKKEYVRNNEWSVGYQMDWTKFQSNEGVSTLSPADQLKMQLSIDKKTIKGLDLSLKTKLNYLDIPIFDEKQYSSQIELEIKQQLKRNKNGYLTHLKTEIANHIYEKQKIETKVSQEEQELNVLLTYWDIISAKTSLSITRKSLLRRFYLMKKLLLHYHKGVLEVAPILREIQSIQNLRIKCDHLKVYKKNLEKHLKVLLGIKKLPESYFLRIKQDQIDMKEEWLTKEGQWKSHTVKMIEAEEKILNQRLNLLEEKRKGEVALFIQVGLGQKTNTFSGSLKSLGNLSEPYFSSGINMELPVGEQEEDLDYRVEKKNRDYLLKLKKIEEEESQEKILEVYNSLFEKKREMNRLEKLCRMSQLKAREVIRQYRNGRLSLREHHLYWEEVHQYWGRFLMTYAEYRKGLLHFLFYKGQLRSQVMKEKNDSFFC